jgi:WD40 repeat protein
VKLWDLGTGACEQTLAGHDGVVTSVALSADGHRALSGSDDRMVKLWDLETGELLRTLGPE